MPSTPPQRGLPKELLAAIKQVKSKRPRTVLDHILKRGHITTEELRDAYGYNHPPRAARDVREVGIPLRMTRVRGGDGRQIAQYTIDVERFKAQRAGRRPVPPALKQQLIAKYGSRCEVCQRDYDELDLQVDHRVPFEVGGDPPFDDLDAFMLLCRAHNREKSWRCEHCQNWIGKDIETCKSCFWASPSDHTHIAMTPARRIDLSFEVREDEGLYDALQQQSRERGVPVQEIIKRSLRRSVQRPS